MVVLAPLCQVPVQEVDLEVFEDLVLVLVDPVEILSRGDSALLRLHHFFQLLLLILLQVPIHLLFLQLLVLVYSQSLLARQVYQRVISCHHFSHVYSSILRDQLPPLDILDSELFLVLVFKDPPLVDLVEARLDLSHFSISVEELREALYPLVVDHLGCEALVAELPQLL